MCLGWMVGFSLYFGMAKPWNSPSAIVGATLSAFMLHWLIR
jgi:hypothetical protein